MSRFCKFGKLHVTKGNVDKIIRYTTDSFQGAKALGTPLSNFLKAWSQVSLAAMLLLNHCRTF